MLVKVVVFLRDFNSIKVRLEPKPVRDAINKLQKFQFHKGTIRTVSKIFAYLGILNFNSIKVRLELFIRYEFCTITLISIP